MSRFEDPNRALGAELLNRAGLALDAGFEESKHPRAENGQFGSGGGGSSGSGQGEGPKAGPHPVSQQSLKARVKAQMDNIHKALGPEKYEIVRKAAYEKGATPSQIGEAEKLLASVGHGEKKEPGAVLPKKAMSEAQKKSNAKAMSSAAARASSSASAAKNDKAKAAYEEASRNLAAAAQAYAEGDHEKGYRLENIGFKTQHHAELNDQ